MVPAAAANGLIGTLLRPPFPAQCFGEWGRSAAFGAWALRPIAEDGSHSKRLSLMRAARVLALVPTGECAAWSLFSQARCNFVAPALPISGPDGILRALLRVSPEPLSSLALIMKGAGPVHRLSFSAARVSA